MNSEAANTMRMAFFKDLQRLGYDGSIPILMLLDDPWLAALAALQIPPDIGQTTRNHSISRVGPEEPLRR